MSDDKLPMTPAIRLLLDKKIAFEPFFYEYEEKGGTQVSSRELGVEEHIVVKTLVMQDEDKKPMVVLMHGDCKVSTKQLARELGVKHIHACDPEVANRHSGYMVGGTSPFATRKVMPVMMQKTILDLDKIYINGGKKGFLIRMSPKDLVTALNPRLVDVIA